MTLYRSDYHKNFSVWCYVIAQKSKKLKMINSNSNNFLYQECEKDGLDFNNNGVVSEKD